MLQRIFLFFAFAILLNFPSTVSQPQDTPQDHRRQADAEARQGDAALRQGDYRVALNKYEASLKAFEQLNDTAGMADSFSNLGRVYTGLGQYEKAAACLEKALALHATVGDRKGRGWDLTRMSAVALNSGRYAKALSLAEQALQIHEEVGNRQALAETLRSISSAHRNVGDHKKAIEYGERSLQIAEEVGDKRETATTLNSLGVAYQEFGNYALARAYYQKSLALAEAVGNKKSMAATHNNIGLLHRELGDYTQAMEHHQQSLKIKVEIGDKRGVGTSLHNIAEVDIGLGHYAEALDHHQKALRIFEEIGAQRELAQGFSTLGIVHRNLGNYDQALEYYKKSLKIREDISDKNGTAQSLHGIASLYTNLGRYVEALQYHERALKLKEEIGNRRIVAVSFHDMGNLHAITGHYDQALAYHQKALQIRNALGDRSGVVQSLSSMGYVYYKMGGLSEADRRLSEAIALAKSVGRQEALSAALYRRGLVLRDTGRTEEAVHSMKAAIQAIEQVRRHIPLAEQKAGFLQEKLEVYESLIALLVQANQPKETFHYAERAKARAFLDLLAEAKAEARKKISPELLEKENMTLARRSYQQRQLQDEASKPNPDPRKLGDLQDQLKRADQEYENLRLEIRRVSPPYAAIKYPEPIRLEQAQPLLDDREILLEYVLGHKESFLLSVTRTDFQVYRLPSRAQLERKVEALAKLLGQPPTESGTLAYVKAAYDLYGVLVQPAQNQFAGKRSLIVVPDGALALLPFQALLTEKIDPAGEIPLKHLPYLVKAGDISYIQSASVLERVKPKGQSGPWAQTFIGFAPIRFDEHRRVSADGLPSADKIQVGIDDLYRGGLRLGNLPFTKRELEWIKNLYGDAQTRLYFEQEATEERVKDGQLKNYRYVHFATHGIIHPDRPEFSSIILRTAGREDGYLQVAEILNLELTADLVALSACQSGRGPSMKGEGLIGLTRGFMYAGAASVLSSLWSVQDKPTAYLMRAFYKNLERTDKSQALRQAQLEFIHGANQDLEYYHHPYYWSPFVLIGAR